MARHIISVFFLFLVLMENAGGSLTLEATPTEVLPGLTESLIVNCSFTFSELSNLSGIISLILSKLDTEGEQKDIVQDLVSINAFSPDQVIVHSQINGAVSGHINGDGESYLTIQWTYPGADQTGLYRCEANGMTDVGYPAEITQTVLVTSEELNFNQLVYMVTDLQHELHDQKNLTTRLNQQLSKQENLTNHLESQLDRQENVITLQSHLIDTLLSLTKNQSDTITAMQKQLDLITFGPSDFHITPKYKEHVYLLSKGSWTNATEAVQTCKDYGGYLAEIKDSDEDTFINDYLDNFDDFTYVLVSGTDEGHVGHWTYTESDVNMTYINWDEDEPNRQDEHCMSKVKYSIHWPFNDIYCSNQPYESRFLCEVNLME